MFERIKQPVLAVLKVPPEPVPPRGSPESVRVFRAAPNFFKLLLLKWGLAQVSAVIGIIVWLSWWDNLSSDWRPLVRTIFQALEWFGIAGFVLQMPFTFATLRLNYELRWYIVTDRSLRIRSGIWTVREMTMTFANIQQITVRQGPLQRLLGLADLQVTTAGGGGSAPAGPAHADLGEHESMHVGYFHGVNNAAEIRDLMLERLRRLRDTGLGDPDDAHAEMLRDNPRAPVLDAATALLEEVRALRQAFT
ncbi:MAG: PH domain-containing protein [Verrucomicrobia bacterium]|nr:PH domain-containing protein [Verrucomicrobiota bacterium]